MAQSTPEHGLNTHSSIESSKLIVRQPEKLAELGKLLETFENLNARVGERAGEDISSDMGGAGMAAGQQGGGSQVSARDLAIDNMPAEDVIREKLVKHLQAEIQQLEKKAQKLKNAARPGVAFHLNEMYARIRRLNSLLAEIITASLDVLKRFFIRVFIDKQSVL